MWTLFRWAWAKLLPTSPFSCSPVCRLWPLCLLNLLEVASCSSWRHCRLSRVLLQPMWCLWCAEEFTQRTALSFGTCFWLRKQGRPLRFEAVVVEAGSVSAWSCVSRFSFSRPSSLTARTPLQKTLAIPSHVELLWLCCSLLVIVIPASTSPQKGHSTNLADT